MCMPGLLTNPNTEGIYKLIKNGAAVITRGQDILDTLDWQIETTVPKKDTNVSESLDLTEEEKPIFELIAQESRNFDSILSLTGMDFGDLMIVLTNLEIKGYIKQTEGEKYMSTVNLG